MDITQAVAYSVGMKKKNPAAVALGRLGGRVKGKCKARTSEQARAAVMVRWNSVKRKNEQRKNM
jgi:hypothetical protein